MPISRRWSCVVSAAQTRSKIPAAPWPVPTHIVTMPYLRLRRRSAWTTVAERIAMPGVSEGRARQLAAGAIVADAAMDLFSLPILEICPWALREGVILRRLDMLSS